MTSEYRLFCFAQSGNAYKPALMLNLCGADWTPRFVDFFGGETRSEPYRALNVMGEVPILEHRGRQLTQSGVILDYLSQTLGRFGWEDDEERREVLLELGPATLRTMATLVSALSPTGPGGRHITKREARRLLTEAMVVTVINDPAVAGKQLKDALATPAPAGKDLALVIDGKVSAAVTD